MFADKLPLKHYLYLLLWGGSLYIAVTQNFVLGFLFLFAFFLITTFSYLKTMILVMIAVGIVSIIFPPVAAILTVLSLLSILFKINFLRKHWRALRVGVYAYFVYIALDIICSVWLVLDAVSMFAVALIATIIFHKMTNNLYQRGYSTDKAFTIIGLTPYTILSFVLPFLKVNVDGQEVFHGLFSDYASLDIHGHIIPTEDLPDEITDAMKVTGVTAGEVIKMTGFNINDIADIPTLSHAFEASVATSAAYGVFKTSSLEKEYTVRNEDGTIEIISRIDDTHAVIKNNHGAKIGTIYFDKEKGLETVILSNGFTYSIEQATGKVIDGEGKFLGKITEDAQGNKILSDENGALIRKFNLDGTI